MPTDPDSDVLALVANGDMTGALRRLMQRHGTAIYRYCCEALRDATLAEDVHQQVFIHAHRDLRSFHGRSTVRTWLFAIANHRVLDAAKARGRERKHLADDDGTAVLDPRLSPGELIDDGRLIAALVECMKRLAVNVRSTVLLRFQQNLTFEEIGRMLGERPGTLQAQVTRALPI